MPCTYRGPHRDPETAGEKYADEVKEKIELMQKKGRKVRDSKQTLSKNVFLLV